MVDLELIKSLIKNVPAPLGYLKDPWLTDASIKNIQGVGQALNLEIELPYPVQDIQSKLIEALQKTLSEKLRTTPQISIDWKVQSHAVGNIQGVPGVKNIIAVASGKGGVGKSTTTVNLALALAHQGARVGILDADIYGPNQPQMLGSTQIGPLSSDKQLEPVVLHGIQSMSIGYLIDTKTPMIWRGPMVSTALQQLLQQTQWDALDYLLIDLPPGTGDIQLTLTQKAPLSGAVIVTTPQDIAILDARKGLEMFRKLKVPVLGVVENMSLHTCSQCGHQESIFGAGGGDHLSQECETELLGKLPLSLGIREDADRGYPTVLAKPESLEAQIYLEIARKIAVKLARQSVNYAVKFPKIVVE